MYYELIRLDTKECKSYEDTRHDQIYTTSNAMWLWHTGHPAFFESQLWLTWVTYSLPLILLKIREPIVSAVRESVVTVLSFCLNAWIVHVSRSPLCLFLILSPPFQTENSMSGKQGWWLPVHICMIRCIFVIICIHLMVFTTLSPHATEKSQKTLHLKTNFHSYARPQCNENSTCVHPSASCPSSVKTR